MLENTDGAIRNGQSRETGNIGTQNEEKQSKNTTETPLCANRHKLFQQDMNVSTNNWR